MIRERWLGTYIPDYRFRGREFTPATWINANHDTDRDGVPNYLDADPLNARFNTFGLRKSR